MRARVLLLAVLAAVLVGCGGDGSTVAWRGLTLDRPEGWSVFEDEPSRLSISNVPLGAEVGEENRPEGDVLAMFFTYEPRTQPDDWRDYAEERDAQLEVDRATEVGGVPARRLQILDESGAAPVRELVVLVPSRQVVLLAQPVPDLGDTDAVEVFDRGVDAFDEVLASIEWGAPVDEPGARGPATSGLSVGAVPVPRDR